MLSDVAVVSRDATFRAPEILRGIADTGYAAYLPTQIGVARARDMLLTGLEIDARTALDWGLVSRMVEPGDELGAGIEIATQIARGAPEARWVVKREINRGYPRYDRMSMEHSLRGPEPIEGFRSFKQDRNPSWVAEDLRSEGRL
jgi:enoyl-CoA hydratase/carnithine racemase